MIVIGSYALALHGHRDLESVKDLDLVGVEEDIERFRETNADIIEKERQIHGHRHAFILKEGQPVDKVEIDTEQAPSDKLLPDLCPETVSLFGMEIALPPVEVLYLTKRAHANVPVHYDKTIAHVLEIKPLVGSFSEAQLAFGAARKQECTERYALNRQRFSLSIRNEDFFDNSDHIRFYVHDDLHEVVAHHEDGPLYKKCKHDLSLAKIDTDLFEALSHDDQLRMVQEEFMVIGLERYFMQDRSLAAPEVYSRGMHKTIRDLFVGYFQDFCIDHVDELQTPPPFDFTERFVKAEKADRLRKVEIEIEPPREIHKQIWQHIQKGELNEARTKAEDLVRSAEHGIDTHAMFLLGATMFRTRQLKPAEKCLRKCLMRDRQNALAWFYLGATLRAAERYGEALPALQNAAKFGFRQFPLHWNLGLCFEAQRMPAKAIAAFKRASQLKPEDPRPAKRIEALTEAVA